MNYAATLQRPEYLELYKAQNIETWNQNGHWRRLRLKEHVP
ncbi:MAG TPA: hypothetical protein V6C97_27615 [Oculatellaceae cyanobacterium]